MNRYFSTFSRACIFFLLILSLLWSSLFFSCPLFSSLLFSSLTLPTSAFPSVHIVWSFTSKPPSAIHASYVFRRPNHQNPSTHKITTHQPTFTTSFWPFPPSKAPPGLSHWLYSNPTRDRKVIHHDFRELWFYSSGLLYIWHPKLKSYLLYGVASNSKVPCAWRANHFMMGKSTFHLLNLRIAKGNIPFYLPKSKTIWQISPSYFRELLKLNTYIYDIYIYSTHVCVHVALFTI